MEGFPAFYAQILDHLPVFVVSDLPAPLNRDFDFIPGALEGLGNHNPQFEDGGVGLGLLTRAFGHILAGCEVVDQMQGDHFALDQAGQGFEVSVALFLAFV